MVKETAATLGPVDILQQRAVRRDDAFTAMSLAMAPCHGGGA